MPLPGSVKAATSQRMIRPLDSVANAGAREATAALPTPRRAMGAGPDRKLGAAPIQSRNGLRLFNACEGAESPEFAAKAVRNFWLEYEWISPSRFGVLGCPIYKPEFCTSSDSISGRTSTILS